MISKLITNISTALEKNKLDYAVAGGIAASYYRDSVRATDDLDIIIGSKNYALKKLKDILSDLELKPVTVTEAQLEGNTRFRRKMKRSEIQLVAGLPQKPGQIKVDFLLHTIPWVPNAVERAKKTVVMVLGKEIPIICLEDLIIAKLIAFRNRPDRLTDYDDIQSIFRNNISFDIGYLSEQLTNFKLSLPKELEKIAHFKLGRISRKNRRKPRG